MSKTEHDFMYDVTEGGVLIRYGVDDAIDLTTPSENPLVMLANIDTVSSLLQNLLDQAPAILAELAALRAEIGEPCGVCNGDGGQEAGTGPLRWVDCPACDGNRVQEVAA
jgi:hypothetical protein